MKKKTFLAMAAAAIMMTGCAGIGSSGGLLSGMDANSLGNIIVSVLGINKVPEATLLGTWNYSGPGCAFTSDNMLAKAGGEVAARKIEAELLPQYQKLGVNSGNTAFTFKEDKSFSAKMAGKSFGGTYTYDANTGAITFKTLLLSMNGYVKMTTNGISLLFESQKVLNVLQTLGAMSGNATAASIAELSKNYDGVRVGFNLKR